MGRIQAADFDYEEYDDCSCEFEVPGEVLDGGEQSEREFLLGYYYLEEMKQAFYVAAPLVGDVDPILMPVVHMAGQGGYVGGVIAALHGALLAPLDRVAQGMGHELSPQANTQVGMVGAHDLADPLHLPGQLGQVRDVGHAHDTPHDHDRT